MLYLDVFRILEEKGVRYIVVGGIAVNMYGYVRLTVDLDIMIDLEKENIKKLISALDEIGYIPRMPVPAGQLADEQKREELMAEKGAVVFTFYNPEAPYHQVDIFLRNPVDFSSTYSQRMNITIEGVNIPVASIDDLIKMKLSTGRERDKEDAYHLEKIKEIRKSEFGRNP